MTLKNNIDSLTRQIVVSLGLLSLLILVAIISLHIWSVQYAPLEPAFQLPTPSLYPVLSETLSPDITAFAYSVMDAQSGHVITSKNANFRFSPASTTKIITSLVGRQLFQPDQVLTVKKAGDEGVLLGLKPGDQLTFTNLLYAMLLPSDNDAAQAVADNDSEGREGFVHAMNDYAAKLHLYQTHFSDPAGLDDDTDYTTPVELSLITREFLKDPLLSHIVTLHSATVHFESGKDVLVKSLNELLGVYGINGVKTGHTEGAKDVLVTSLPIEGHEVIIVIMKSDDRFADTRLIAQTLTRELHYVSIGL